MAASPPAADEEDDSTIDCISPKTTFYQPVDDAIASLDRRRRLLPDCPGDFSVLPSLEGANRNPASA
nr:hypothetical protein Iba_chr05cCG9640 [Ipomoea batatas]